MYRYVLALDQGTTSSRAILFDRQGRPVDMVQKAFDNLYPQPGWVEQDPIEIYAGQYSVMMELLAKTGTDPAEIAAIGITNQRETTIVWDKTTGKPVYPAIVWQCRRTTAICEQLEREGMADYIRQTTGLPVDAYFSATKLYWILEQVEGVRARAERGELLFGTVDSWLLWKLTGGAVHATDYTNAARTMLWNIHTLSWDDRLLSHFRIPRAMLPEVRPSSTLYGYANLGGVQVPISGIAGDQQAALFGHACFEKGDAKNTYGTGCFLLMHTGDTPYTSAHGLLTSVAASGEGQPPQYVLEGSVFTGGATMQWLRDGLRLITDAEDSEYYAGKVADTGGVYLVPAFAGMGAPYWDMHARGMLVGLTRGSGRRQIVRAALESIAYRTQDVIAAMRADTGAAITALRVDGGASANRFLMQFQADISDVTLYRPAGTEATARGAAFLAGLSCGFWESAAALAALPQTADGYTPRMLPETRQALLAGWRRAVKAARVWAAEAE